MSAKKNIVDRVKERELAAARAKQAANQPQGGYTPFGQDTNRAVEDLDELADHHTTFFYTSEDPTKVLKRVDEVLRGLGAKDVAIKDEKFKIKAIVAPGGAPPSGPVDEADEPQPLALGMGGGDQIQIAAQILAVPNESGLCALAFELRDGDQMTFLKLFRGELTNQLGDVIASSQSTGRVKRVCVTKSCQLACHICQGVAWAPAWCLIAVSWVCRSLVLAPDDKASNEEPVSDAVDEDVF